jgi:hypothetical protein
MQTTAGQKTRNDELKKKQILLPHAIVGYILNNDAGQSGIVMRRISRIELVLQWRFVEDVKVSDDFMISAGQQSNILPSVSVFLSFFHSFILSF